MDSTEVQKITENSLLEELVNNSKKQLFYARIRTVLTLVIAGGIALCMAVLVPKLILTIENANSIMAQASETITLASEAIESITSMSESITTMGDNMDTFITDNSETLTGVMEKIEGIDFEGLNSAIEDLGAVVEPLANFFGKFTR